MLTKATGFFEETAGVRSYVRLVGFILLIADLGIMCWHEVKHRSSMGGEAYSDNYCYFQIVILSFVFFPKVMQKVVEAFLQWKTGEKTDSTTEKTSLTVEKTTV